MQPVPSMGHQTRIRLLGGCRNISGTIQGTVWQTFYWSGVEGYPATGVHAALFSGGSVYTSSMEIDDATVTWTGSLDSSYLFGEALSATDMNGDGADEVLLAYPYHGDGYSYEGAVGVFDASNMSAGNYDQEDADWL